MQLLVILGPPAVGKMTVGRVVAQRSSYRLFHNHHSIEMLLDVFDYGTPPFRTLNTELRRRVIEEAAAAGTDLVFTFVMGMDEQAEADHLEALVEPYGDRVAVVELVADLDTRLVRNRTEHRLAEKKSKRDVEWSDDNVRELEAGYRMSAEPGREAPGERLLARWPHLVIVNTELLADEAADRILACSLPTGNVRGMPAVLDLWKKTTALPFGDRVFSLAFSQKAPYFATIRPRFTVLEPNRAELVIRKRRGVHNHLGTVHAIALCNGLEAAMGALAEATIPRGRRWIPKGMEVAYTAKATSDITCIAETDPEQWTQEILEGYDLPVRVRGVRTDGTVVVEGEIRLWVSAKKG